MQMKLTLREALDLAAAIANIQSSVKLRVVAAYRLSANHKKLLPYVESYNETARSWFEELAVMTKDGKDKEIDPKKNKEAYQEYMNRDAELLATEVTIDLDKIPLSKFAQPNETILMKAMYGLMPVVTDDLEDVEDS